MASLTALSPSEQLPHNYKASHSLTLACAVAANVLIVLIIYLVFFFWKRDKGSVRDIESSDNTSSTENSPCSSPRASSDKVKDLSFLPEFVHGETGSGEENEECTVCIAEFVNGQIGRVLPACGHKFHMECIDTWFKKHSTCPICRRTIKETNTEEKEEKICLNV